MALNELEESSNVNLAWVPGHKGIKGNERADSLAMEGESKPFIGFIPVCATMKRKIARIIAKWSADKALQWWRLLRTETGEEIY